MILGAKCNNYCILFIWIVIKEIWIKTMRENCYDFHKWIIVRYRIMALILIIRNRMNGSQSRGREISCVITRENGYAEVITQGSDLI